MEDKYTKYEDDDKFNLIFLDNLHSLSQIL